MGSKKTLPLYWAFGSPGFGWPANTENSSIGLPVTGTNTYLSVPSQVYNLDNLGLQVQWTGTTSGTITILGSNDGNAFYALTFDPALTQPSGTAGGYLINLNQFPWVYLQVEYVNSSGSGTLVAIVSGKDLN